MHLLFFFFFFPRLVLKPSTLPDIQVTDVDATMNAEGTGSSTGETEMDLAAPLRAVPCSAPASLHSSYICKSIKLAFLLVEVSVPASLG